MKKILLTGASGFIGVHCIPVLLSNGYDVHAVSSREPPPAAAGVVWHTSDLLSQKSVQALMKTIEPTHLLHLAWYTEPGRYWNAPENNDWLYASQFLAEEFIRCGGQRVVVAGTCAEYDWSYGYCSEGVTPENPATLYGKSKHALFRKMEEICPERGVSSAWGRVFFPFGPQEHPSKLVSSVISALLRGIPAPCTTGSQVRDYLFVEDVADAFVRILDSPVTGPVNIASGKGVRIRDIINLIGEKTGRGNLLRFGDIPTPPAEVPALVADIRRLSQEVGWHQTTDLESGLDKTISWWRKKIEKDNVDLK